MFANLPLTVPNTSLTYRMARNCCDSYSFTPHPRAICLSLYKVVFPCKISRIHFSFLLQTSLTWEQQEKTVSSQRQHRSEKGAVPRSSSDTIPSAVPGDSTAISTRVMRNVPAKQKAAVPGTKGSAEQIRASTYPKSSSLAASQGPARKQMNARGGCAWLQGSRVETHTVLPCAPREQPEPAGGVGPSSNTLEGGSYSYSTHSACQNP